MDLQIPLLIIDRRNVSVMSILFMNRRMTPLRFVDAFLNGYGTPEKILDITEIVSGYLNSLGGYMLIFVITRINKY